MFTGIVREAGNIVGCEAMPGGLRLIVDAPSTTAGAAFGDSIAVDGCCLTVTAVENSRITFELSGETLSRTIAGTYSAGVRVNLEGSLRMSDKLGGHFVTGHVDCVARALALSQEGGFAILSVALDADAARGFVAEKGSIAVNGVSLTVASWSRASGVFTVALIPATLDQTNLCNLGEGSQVNIEYDLIARYLREMMEKRT